MKQCLQRKKFVLPQQSRNISEHFCNEAVYGKLNVLCVSGVVRLDATEAVGEGASAAGEEEVRSRKARQQAAQLWRP